MQQDYRQSELTKVAEPQTEAGFRELAGLLDESLCLVGQRITLPRVTVLVPTRNEERHITGCLASLLDQDYPSGLIDIIVIDGDSTDSTVEHVQRLAGSTGRVRCLRNPERHTVFALNRGLLAASGDIVI